MILWLQSWSVDIVVFHEIICGLSTLWPEIIHPLLQTSRVQWCSPRGFALASRPNFCGLGLESLALVLASSFQVLAFEAYRVRGGGRFAIPAYSVTKGLRCTRVKNQDVYVKTYIFLLISTNFLEIWPWPRPRGFVTPASKVQALAFGLEFLASTTSLPMCVEHRTKTRMYAC
jgi:hypothetical protein